MARKCDAPGCGFYLPDRYPLDNISVAPETAAQGPVKIGQLHLQLLLLGWAEVLGIRSLQDLFERREAAEEREESRKRQAHEDRKATSVAPKRT